MYAEIVDTEAGEVLRISEMGEDMSRLHEELTQEWRELHGQPHGEFLESDTEYVVLFALQGLNLLETATRVHGMLLGWGESSDMRLKDGEGTEHLLKFLASRTIFTGKPPWDRRISIAEARMLQLFLYRLTTRSFRTGLLASATVTGIRPKDSGLLAALKLLEMAWQTNGRTAYDAVYIATTYAHALATVAYAAEQTPVPGYETRPSIDLLRRLMAADAGPGGITLPDLETDYTAEPFNMNP